MIGKSLGSFGAAFGLGRPIQEKETEKCKFENLDSPIASSSYSERKEGIPLPARDQIERESKFLSEETKKVPS